MTLCFCQKQAAAVYAATKGSKSPVYVSPFIGRLDDVGQNGVDVITNILRMFAGATVTCWRRFALFSICFIHFMPVPTWVPVFCQDLGAVVR